MGTLPVSALLSQTLVAYTIEADNQFELNMREKGLNGHISLMLWLNLMQFVPENGIAFRELVAQTLLPQEAVKGGLGCLERWGYMSLNERSRAGDDWGSGRGIRGDSIIRPTEKGLAARSCWDLNAIEKRWTKRFGTGAISKLRESLARILDPLEFDLPQALPVGSPLEAIAAFLPRTAPAELPLVTMLSQVLTAFALEFDRQSEVSLGLSANVIRVLDLDGVRLSDLPRLTGCSPETTAIGWRLQHSACVSLSPDPAGKRGKLVRLTERGVRIQAAYSSIAAGIEETWAAPALRTGLENLRTDKFREGLIPPEGVLRAGAQTPALGRRVVAAAARQRMRDVIAQTQAFLADPFGSLPHYPLWDMNRGFGP